MKEFGAKKTLIIYGSDRIIQNGLFDVATKSLSANGIEFCKIGGVKSNSSSYGFGRVKHRAAAYG